MGYFLQLLGMVVGWVGIAILAFITICVVVLFVVLVGAALLAVLQMAV